LRGTGLDGRLAHPDTLHPACAFERVGADELEKRKVLGGDALAGGTGERAGAVDFSGDMRRHGESLANSFLPGEIEDAPVFGRERAHFGKLRPGEADAGQIACAVDRVCSSSIPHLSRRELQCLRFAAAGKTDMEIALILGISGETARQYVKRARAAYDVVSRTQLVVLRLRDDWISFDEALDPRSLDPSLR